MYLWNPHRVPDKGRAVSRRAIPLTERRTRPARLPRDEAVFLMAHARHVIDVAPTAERGVFKLTPRGFVGFIDGPTVRYTIGPKIPWPNLCLLLGLAPESETEAAGDAVEPDARLLAVLATAFAERLEAVTRAGLVAGYGERPAVSPFLRGKLRTADQMRDAAGRAFPGHFHIDEPVFDLQTPWNRVPKATAAALLRADLPRAARQRVEAAAVPLAVLPDEPATELDFAAARAEPRAAGYAPLLDVCELVLNGPRAANPVPAGAGAFLIDLGAAFERYLAGALAGALEPRAGWRVVAHPRYPVGPTELIPDLVVERDGAPWAVLDAKWKTARPVPDADDLHQILAYATVTGAGRVGLVYPGSTADRAHFATPDRRARASVYRVRVVGSADELAESIRELAESV